MKLSDVTFRDGVNEPDSSTPGMRFTDSQPNIASISLEQGIVTLTGAKGGVRLVPIQNVKFMTPAKQEAKK